VTARLNAEALTPYQRRLLTTAMNSPELNTGLQIISSMGLDATQTDLLKHKLVIRRQSQIIQHLQMKVTSLSGGSAQSSPGARAGHLVSPPNNNATVTDRLESPMAGPRLDQGPGEPIAGVHLGQQAAAPQLRAAGVGKPAAASLLSANSGTSAVSRGGKERGGGSGLLLHDVPGSPRMRDPGSRSVATWLDRNPPSRERRAGALSGIGILSLAA
jgi:hypothetical protein